VRVVSSWAISYLLTLETSRQIQSGSSMSISSDYLTVRIVSASR
jgi:hypothetical protein